MTHNSPVTLNLQKCLPPHQESTMGKQVNLANPGQTG